MATIFRIGDRCGFNLAACEETPLLEAWRLVGDGLDAFAQDLFRRMVLEEGRGVHELAIIGLNERLAAAGIEDATPVRPRLSGLDAYMRSRGDEKVALRKAMLRRLEDPTTRERMLRQARAEYDRLRPPEIDDPEAEEMFAAALERIEGGGRAALPRRFFLVGEAPAAESVPAPVPPPAPAPAARGALALARPVPEPEPAISAEAVRVAAIAQRLAAVRRAKRQAQEAMRLAEHEEGALVEQLAGAIEEL